MKCHFLLLMLSALVLAGTAPGQVTIELTNGKVVAGTIHSQDERFLVINTGTANVRVLKGIIKTVNDAPYLSQSSAAGATTPQVTAPQAAMPPPVAPAAVATEQNQKTVAPPAPALQAAVAQDDFYTKGSAFDVKLKNGTVFRGTVVVPGPNFISFNVNGSQLNILRGIILSATPVQPQSAGAPQAQAATPQHPEYGPQSPLVAIDTTPRPATFNEPTLLQVPLEQATPLTPTAADTISPVQNVPSPNSPVGLLVKELYVRDPLRQIRACRELQKLGSEASAAIAPLTDLFSYTTPYAAPKRGSRKETPDTTLNISPAQAASEALGAIGPASVPRLLAILTSPSEPLRAGAARTLGLLRDTLTVEALANALLDSAATVRTQAARALGAIRDPRSIPMLVTLLAQDTTAEVQSATQEALVALTDLDELIKGLRHEHPVVRTNSQYILWLMTQKEFKDDINAWESWWAQERMAGK